MLQPFVAAALHFRIQEVLIVSWLLSPSIDFQAAIVNILRVARIFGQSWGHTLLTGAAQSGKKTIAQLAAHMCSISHFYKSAK